VKQPAGDAQLDTLEAKGLVRPAVFEPELEYLFRHVLVQDAAYASLLKQERRELHRLVGETMERLYPERGAELAGILAMHFEQAGDQVKAIGYLVDEGNYALERNALHEAYAAFGRARALMPEPTADEDGTTLRTRVQVELGRARAGYTFLASEDVVAALEEIVEPAERLGDLELSAQVHLYMALTLLESGHPATEAGVQRSLRRIEEIGVELDDPSLGALPLALVGLNKVFVGPIREGVQALEQAIPLMERRRDFIGAAFSRGWLAIGYATLGDFDKAAVAERHATEEAERGDLIAQLDAQIAQAMIRALRGELDEAEPIAQACVARSQETGATACAVVSAWVLGDVYHRQGRLDDAREVLQLGWDLSPVVGLSTSVWRPTLRAWLDSTQQMMGVSDPDEAAWQDTLEGARRARNRPGEAGILAKHAEVLLRAGRAGEAAAAFAAAAKIYEEEGARPLLARVLRGWGQALRAAGQPQDANERLQRAAGLLDDMGLLREATEVRREIGDPGPA
jgi:tetratricopeptide (TPR) repeat protein